jgi:hypothetical protein
VVDVGSVTAQLLYEIGAPQYANPDVISHFDTLRVEQVGDDRVRISEARGTPGPPTTKVCINLDGGYRNRVTFVLTGLDQEAKARWASDALFARLGGRDRFEAVDERLVEAPPSAPGHEASSGRLHIHVKSPDERLVGRAFSSAAIELALANYPGFFVSSPPTEAQSYGVYWPALVANDELTHVVVHHDGRREQIASPSVTGGTDPLSGPAVPDVVAEGPAIGEPLGRYFAARSGDKGGNANVGIYARGPAGYRWLHDHLTADAVARLIPEAAGLEIRRYELPNVHALNFVIVGYLGDGVASSTAFDPQATGLGEYLRARIW